MKVAFWNGAGYNGGVTDYVAAIGIFLALSRKCQVVLGSNYISNHMLQDCFSSRIKEQGIAHNPYCYSYGTPEYFRGLWEIRLSRTGPVSEKPMEGITIINPPDVAEKSMFYYKVPQNVFYFLDIAGENNAASLSALEEAELVIVFLPQDVTEIQKFFQRFSSLIPKALFVIEGNSRNWKAYRSNLESKYGISRENIAIIPNNSDYTEACEEGRLDFYIMSHMKQATKEPKYNFMSCLREITKLLYEHSFSEKKKEREDEKL